ncbi:ABC transporter substrate-binding protein [Sanguibacter sp. HDW7]|uniref:ABC transporter substrate-binding protein n=1 Tax=Sanguibacter sp. HDW7 TaxID=2714931 RepID=UPI001407C0FC|nr:ABC transporter substrate-binding protein [Sanguibacter sp. HDW7]QIK82932.1 ABC transporter substrate-binding protein [Sanguibacter sp. HDW7]
MTSRHRLSLAAVLAGMLALAACSGGSSDTAAPTSAAPTASSTATSAEAGTATVASAFGDVEIPAAPKRVVALEGAVGPLLAAGITPVATADGDWEDAFLPAEFDQVKDLPVVLGPDGWDYEAIAAAKPDLLIGFVRAGTVDEISPEAVAEHARLSGIAPTVLILADGSASTKDATLKIAEIVGSGTQATEAKAAYDAKAAQIRETYAGALAAHTFAAVDHYEGIVTVYTPISWLGGILTDVGASIDPVAADATGTNGVDLSTEELTRLSPDSVILTEQALDGTPGIGAEELDAVPTYTTLPAVAAGHAYGVQYFFADRYETGLKVLDQLETILAGL